MDLWDLHNQGRINAASTEARHASSKASGVATDLHLLERRVDHLTLLCQSMWELLRDHSDLSEQQLRAKIADVDTRDGKADGKIRKNTFPCPKCQATCHSANQSCIMCGADLKMHKTHLFEA